MNNSELRIARYNRQGLRDLIDSDMFKSMKSVPVSYHRALSHIHNPRLEENDIILVVAWYGEEAVAFRTVLADVVFNGDLPVKVGWISGTWVDPRYRRQGLASLLFAEIRSAWNDALMYTNYAPLSKRIYDATHFFHTYLERRALRFHLRSDLRTLLPLKRPVFGLVKPLLTLCDTLLNAAARLLLSGNQHTSVRIRSVSSLTADELERLFAGSLTRRGSREWEWIMRYPWILPAESKGEHPYYAFSAWAGKFEQSVLSVGNGTALAVVNIRDGQMRVPYYHAASGNVELLADGLLWLARNRKVKRMDVYDELLNRTLLLCRRRYLVARPLEWKYMVSGAIVKRFPDPAAVRIPDGEGELIFL